MIGWTLDFVRALAWPVVTAYFAFVWGKGRGY